MLGVSREGDRLTLQTAQAPIQLAYKKLHARIARTTAIDAPAATQRAATIGEGTVEGQQPYKFVLFDGDGNEATTNDQVTIDGTLGGGFDYRFGLDVDWGAIDALPDVVTSCLLSLAKILTGQPPDCSIDSLLPEARVSFDVLPKVTANAQVRGAAIFEFQRDADLVSKTLPPILLGPLVIVPAVDVTASLSGGASAAFSTGVRGSATFHTSVIVSSKTAGNPQFSPPRLERTEADASAAAPAFCCMRPPRARRGSCWNPASCMLSSRASRSASAAMRSCPG